jgi:hypothetical protein
LFICHEILPLRPLEPSWRLELLVGGPWRSENSEKIQKISKKKAERYRELELLIGSHFSVSCHLNPQHFFYDF